jgi:hypothetical protein
MLLVYALRVQRLISQRLPSKWFLFMFFLSLPLFIATAR